MAINQNIGELLQKIGERERKIVAHFLHRKPVAQNPNVVFDQQMTLGQRVADEVAAFGGSWPFIFLFLIVMSLWMLVNAEATRPFDPYPFILLNLVLSCLAALQAPVIMMSQNRQAAKDRLDAQHDYEVNLKAELEVMALHTKMDEIREQRFSELMAVQERQLELLKDLEERVATLLEAVPQAPKAS